MLPKRRVLVCERRNFTLQHITGFSRPVNDLGRRPEIGRYLRQDAENLHNGPPWSRWFKASCES